MQALCFWNTSLHFVFSYYSTVKLLLYSTISENNLTSGHESFLMQMLTSFFKFSLLWNNASQLQPHFTSILPVPPHVPTPPDTLLLHFPSKGKSGLPLISNEQDTSRSIDTSHKASEQDGSRQLSRRKRVRGVRDTTTPTIRSPTNPPS